MSTHRSFLPDRLNKSFFFESPTQTEIVEIANSLGLNTAAGHDRFSLLKSLLIVFLTHVLNI